jgi:drug/metabolite transporter (DMT)-like permease
VNQERRGILLIVAAALLWSTSGLGIKAVPLSPLLLTSVRSLFAGITLYAIFRPRVVRWSVPFIIATLSYAGTLITFVVATKWTTAANAILLQYAGVIWVLLFSSLVAKEKPRRVDIIAIGIAMCGMLLFFVNQLEARGMAGNIMALISSFFFAALILSLRIERSGSAEAAVTYGNFVIVLGLLPFIARDFDGIDTRSWITLMLMGVFQIGIAYALFVRGLRYVTATEASLTGMIEPIANPLWVFLFLGERPELTSVIGGAIVLAAVAWRTIMTRGAEAIPPPPE